MGKSVRWWVTPWRDWDVVFLLDVTDQKRAEEASRYLLNSLSHELHTPLSGILTHLEILQLSEVSEEIRQQSLGMLKAEAERLSRMVRLMLELVEEILRRHGSELTIESQAEGEETGTHVHFVLPILPG